jgi:hypothetical protein
MAAANLTFPAIAMVQDFLSVSLQVVLDLREAILSLFALEKLTHP